MVCSSNDVQKETTETTTCSFHDKGGSSADSIYSTAHKMPGSLFFDGFLLLCFHAFVFQAAALTVATLLLGLYVVSPPLHVVREHVDKNITPEFKQGVDRFSRSIQAVVDNAPRPGELLAAAGLRAHFPLVFIPGIVSTGLEVWEGEPCAKKHFRERLWGSVCVCLVCGV